MKIAIPTDDGTNFAAHTGRAAGVIVYQIRDGQTSLVARRFKEGGNECSKGEEQHSQACAGNHSGEHSHQSHDSLLSMLEGCDVLLAQGAGPRLVNDLARRGIQVQFCRETDVERALSMLCDGSLTLYETGSCDHGKSGH